MIDLIGKVALVTGAGGGIGHETAQTLQRAGASVIATDLQAPDGVGDLVTLAQDVTKADDWERAIGEARSRFGRLDILVNNAGTMLGKPLMETTLEEWRGQMTVNAESVFLGIKAAAPLMAETAAQHGISASIINLSSIYGQVVSRMHAAYSASKGAVRLLSKAAAMELMPKNIRVNSVHPGPIDTNLGQNTYETLIRLGIVKDAAEAKASLASRMPSGKLGETNDIAGVILFLASDLSRYMTGSEVTVDGGFTAM